MLAFESTNMHYAHALAVWGPGKQEPPAITSVDTKSACRQQNRNVQRFALYKVAIGQPSYRGMSIRRNTCARFWKVC